MDAKSNVRSGSNTSHDAQLNNRSSPQLKARDSNMERGSPDRSEGRSEMMNRDPNLRGSHARPK